MAIGIPLFHVDEPNCSLLAECGEEGSFYVDVVGMGSVVIKASPEGISVDIFPQRVVDEPICSMWASMDDLVEKDTCEAVLRDAIYHLKALRENTLQDKEWRDLDEVLTRAEALLSKGN